MFKKGFNLLEIFIILLIILIIIFILIISRYKVGSTVIFKLTGDKGIITEVLKSKSFKCFVVKVKDKETIVSSKDIKRD